MARIRSIKPEFFTSLTIADRTPEERLTFIGLWCYVDDNGVGVDEPRLVRAAVWPLDDRTSVDVEKDLEALRSAGLIMRYEHGGRRFLYVNSFTEHQKVSHPRKPRYPTPDRADNPDGTPPDQGPSQPSGEPPEDSGEPPEDYESPPEILRPEQGSGSREQGAGSRESRAPAREAPEADNRPLPERMTDAFLDRYKRGNAYTRKHVRRVIADTLANGTDPGELWAALERLGATSRPISDGTLQFAFADIRKHAAPPPGVSNVVALTSGQPLPGTDSTVAGWAALATQLRDQGDSA